MTFYDRKTSQAIQEFKEWREQLTSSLSRRRDALIDLIDALSSNQQATFFCRTITQSLISKGL